MSRAFLRVRVALRKHLRLALGRQPRTGCNAKAQSREVAKENINEMCQSGENRGWIARLPPARSTDRSRCHWSGER